MEQKDTNFIHLDGANSSQKEGNIFTELGEDLDFGATREVEQKTGGSSWLQMWYSGSYVVMVLSIVIAILASIDVFMKASTDNTILAMIPGCEYISTYGTEVPNAECKTSSMLLAQYKKDFAALEDSIGKSMTVVLPKFLEITNVTNLPEVRFIQERTSNARVNIIEMLAAFQKIKNDNTLTYGSFIDCTPSLADEKGQLEVSCQSYGGRLLGENDITSRRVAVEFLDKLGSKTSPFIITDMPKTLDISQFNSVDPGKAVFNSQTNFTIKLKFIPNTKF